MTYEELFEDSRSFHPTGGAQLPPAACAFIEPEINSLVDKYEKQLADETGSPMIRRMIEDHLSGLRAIQAMIADGAANKPGVVA